MLLLLTSTDPGVPETTDGTIGVSSLMLMGVGHLFWIVLYIGLQM